MAFLPTFDFFILVGTNGCLVSAGFTGLLTAEGCSRTGGGAEVNFGSALRCFRFRSGEGCLAFSLDGGVRFLIKEENV